MGFQLIVKADRKKIDKALGPLISEREVFPVVENLFGISIPARILSSVSEEIVLTNFSN